MSEPSSSLALRLRARTRPAHITRSPPSIPRRKSRIKGTVKVFKFENPHVNIILTVTDPKDSHTTDWFFEAASVRGLVITGWRKSTLKPGDVVTLTGHPIRDGRPGASLMRAQLADGTILQANPLAIQNY